MKYEIIVLDLSTRELLGLNASFMALGDFATMATGVILENQLVLAGPVEIASKLQKMLNEQYAEKDENGNLVYDENDQLIFSPSSFRALQTQWDEYIEKTTREIKLIQFSDEDFKVGFINKAGKVDYKKVELPPRVLLPLRRHNILKRPENLPEINTQPEENSEPEA